ARAAMKIAREIDRPDHEIAQVQQMITESDRIVHAFWNKQRGYHHAGFDPNERAGGPSVAFTEGTEAATLVALLGVARPDERRRMIEFCRREYVTDSGVLCRYPKSAKASTGGHKQHLSRYSDFSLKESELLAV